MSFLDEISFTAKNAAQELCEKANIKPGQIIIVGCSTSEITGHTIGSSPGPDIGITIFAALNSVFSSYGAFIAAQCCEHLNRAVIAAKEAVPGLDIVNAVPHPDAGGSFAAAAYKAIHNAVAVEDIRADAGLDIGATLIAMHLKKVAVPIRLKTLYIGKAPVTAARTRPKLVGGIRTLYDENLS